MENEIVIEAADLSIGYFLKNKKEKLIHSGLNLSLYAGEVTSLLGLNGAGKSTLLRTLCGFQPSLKGEISLMSKPLSSYSQSEFALTVGVVLTEKTNAGGITVYELVSLGRHPYTGFFGKLHDKDKKIILHSMEMVGISHKANNYVSELSDGERQKAMIAKALAQECPVIILDEPTAFLDVTSRIEIMILLHKLAEEENKAILLSTHDIDLAIQLSDSLWLLKKEEEMRCGTPEDLILNGAFDKFFDKEDIKFDAAKGKFSTSLYMKEIRIEGDPVTKHWVCNALGRIHFKASSQPEGYPLIKCFSPDNILLSLSDGHNVKINNIKTLLNEIKKYSSTC